MTTEVEIEGAPIEELFQVLKRLEPLKVPEIYWFAEVPNQPGYVDPRVARIRRSHDWIPLTLQTNRDGGRHISVGVEGVELLLNEENALRFISFVREYRRGLDEILEGQSKFEDPWEKCIELMRGVALLKERMLR